MYVLKKIKRPICFQGKLALLLISGEIVGQIDDDKFINLITGEIISAVIDYSDTIIGFI